MKLSVILMNDGLVTSRESTADVIPAKAGIQEYQPVKKHWTPAFAGVTTFCGFINE